MSHLDERGPLSLDQIAQGDENLREALLRRAEWLRSRHRSVIEQLDPGIPIPEPVQVTTAYPTTGKEFLQHLVANGSDLAGAIEELLSFLEDCRGRRVRLPADCVDLAATLIRMYSETKTTDVPTWITRERARRLAAQLADKRILGSDFRPSKRSRRLPPRPKRSRLNPDPENLTLFDLVQTFRQILDKARSHPSQ